MFLRERFLSLALKPVEVPNVLTKAVTSAKDFKVKKTYENYKLRAWKWQNAKPLCNKSLIKIIDDKKKLSFHPYSYTRR